MNERMAKYLLSDWVYSPWFEESGRPKTLKAMITYLKTLSDEELVKLTEVDIMMAPNPGVMGGVYDFISPASEVDRANKMMYFSPVIENESQKTANYIVAHEFAHILLGHIMPKGTSEELIALIDKNDKEADDHAKARGFVKPLDRKAKSIVRNKE